MKKYSHKQYDCILFSGNKHLFTSRKEAKELLELVQIEAKYRSKVLILDNVSETAHEEPWAGQMEKEEAKKTEFVGELDKLRDYMISVK